MNTTAGLSFKNKRKNTRISNSLSDSRKPRSITRKTLTGQQKKKLCEMFNTHLHKNKELAEIFSISPSTVTLIVSEKDKWLSLDDASQAAKIKRNKVPKFPNIEKALVIWLENAINDNQSVSGHIILEKAHEFATRLGVHNFNGSNGWLEKFKNRNHIKEYRRIGEGNSAPLEDLENYRQELRELTSAYELCDIFNADETALFWRMEPTRTLSTRPVSGTKKSKERITVFLTCNATGEEKFPPLFIHKFENPRPIKNIEKSSLPVWYYWNKKAWMQSSIFNHYLKRINSLMERQNRNILLLVDNASCHSPYEDTTLSNITLHYLPPNTTAHLQPCDAGIIYSFKVILCFRSYKSFFLYKLTLTHYVRLIIANYSVNLELPPTTKHHPQIKSHLPCRSHLTSKMLSIG
jgi:hypothetical protein